MRAKEVLRLLRMRREGSGVSAPSCFDGETRPRDLCYSEEVKRNRLWLDLNTQMWWESLPATRTRLTTPELYVDIPTKLWMYPDYFAPLKMAYNLLDFVWLFRARHCRVCVWNFSKEVKPAPALLQQRTSMYLFINDFVDIPRGYCHCFLCC